MAAKKSDKKEIKQTDVELMDMTGPVKQVKQTFHKVFRKGDIYERGKIVYPVGKSHSNGITIFNEKGKKIEAHLFSEDGHIYKQFYNEDGKATNYSHIKADGSIHYTGKHIYNKNGLEIENSSYNADGTFSSKIERSYNERGQQTECIQYFKENEIWHKSVWVYDINGFKIEDISTNGDGTLSHRNIFKNDKNGHCIQMEMYKSDGNLDKRHTFEVEYDSEGNYINNNQYHKDLKRASLELEENAWERDAFTNWIEKWDYYKGVMVSVTVREIIYYGEQPPFKEYLSKVIIDDKPIVEMKSNLTDENIPLSETALLTRELSNVRWIAEAASLPENFSAFRYYVIINNDSPSVLDYSHGTIEVIALMRELIESMGAQVVHSFSEDMEENDHGMKSALIRYTLVFPDKGYILLAPEITEEEIFDYDVPDYVRQLIKYDYDDLFTSQVRLLHPSDASGKRDKDFEEELQAIIEMCTLEKIPDQPKIYMVEVVNSNFHLQSHAIDDSFEIRNLDMNYGFGFEKFHNELMLRFQNETKGLVLFHGEPGTGKTYYIRHLLRSMANNKKIVIYMPPNMVDHLVEPGFMTFISKQVTHYSQQGFFCVLLIEDAEPLLAARSTDTRIQGVTNLLNMTDGLLNDMLSLQIICTFNVGLKKLDKALLRPGRLIARKEFKAMSALDANRLAQQLGAKHHFTKPAPLSEVYALVKDKNTLIHDVDENGEDMS